MSRARCCLRQPVLDEGKIQILVAAVKFIADNWMTKMRKMDADLMFAAGAGFEAEQGKVKSRMEDDTHLTPALSPHPMGGEGEWFGSRGQKKAGKSAFNPKLRLRRCAISANAILDGNDAGFILAQRRVNDPLLRHNVAVDNGQIIFFNGAAFKNFSQFAGGFGIFGDDDDAAGLAVEPVDEMGLGLEH